MHVAIRGLNNNNNNNNNNKYNSRLDQKVMPVSVLFMCSDSCGAHVCVSSCTIWRANAKLVKVVEYEGAHEDCLSMMGKDRDLTERGQDGTENEGPQTNPNGHLQRLRRKNCEVEGCHGGV